MRQFARVHTGPARLVQSRDAKVRRELKCSPFHSLPK